MSFALLGSMQRFFQGSLPLNNNMIELPHNVIQRLLVIRNPFLKLSLVPSKHFEEIATHADSSEKARAGSCLWVISEHEDVQDVTDEGT
jgi:hypothetical protein